MIHRYLIGMITEHKSLFNFFGWPTNLGAIFLNVNEFFPKNINLLLTIIISVLAIVWWSMKIYDQYISTRQKRLDIKLKSQNDKP